MPEDVKPVSLPIKEAKKFWEDKVPTTRAEFDELVEASHAKAFMVSGLNRMDQVNTVYEALYQAVSDGETFEDFKGRIADIIDATGWKGKRLDVIFRTNVQSAYMAGRYSQMSRASKLRPFWQYSAINDSRTRPAHRQVHGMIFPADHEFWNTWYPPNGYRCRCTVVSLSKREMERRGLSVEKTDPTGDLYEPVDYKTGNKMPARLLMPDRGFSNHVGKDWLSGLAPSEIAEKEVTWLKTKTFCKDGQGMFSAEDCKVPLGRIDKRHIFQFSDADLLDGDMPEEQLVKAFLGEFGIGSVTGSKVIEIPGKIPLTISKDLFTDKRTGAWKVKKSGRSPYLKLLARTIKTPYEIWQVPASVAGKPSPVLRMIRIFAKGSEKIGGFAAFNLIGGRMWTGATIFVPKIGRDVSVMLDYLENQRQGMLLYREK